ncbi:MAG: thermonuclease family protein [Planctomycetota bacterium]|jgi:endonuclease YncB( thermonuclease family)
MKRLAPLALLLCLPVYALAAPPKEALPKSLTGKVVSVADGDTVTVLVDKTPRRVRVDSIDCPERGQPFGTRARQFTSKVHRGNRYKVTWGPPRFGSAPPRFGSVPP